MISVGFCLATFGAQYQWLRDAAKQIDQLGFRSVHVWDHYVSWNDPREPVLEAWVTLGGLAEATERVRLGPLVANNTNRHPARLAKVAATLHELSGGRCVLGIGAGGYAGEQVPFGIAQGGAQERFERLDEAVQIIAALWGGAPVTFHGQHYQLDGAVASPGQRPPPPLLVAASQPRTARMAGQRADGLVIQWRHRAALPALLAALDAGLAARGRDRAGFEVVLHAALADVGADPARRLAEWQAQGITQTVLYTDAPFPLGAIERLARLGPVTG